MEERLKCHKENDVWESRTSPPEDWNKPLPPELAKMSEDSIFQRYQENNGVLPREYGEGILSSVFITGNRSIWGAIKRSLFGDRSAGKLYDARSWGFCGLAEYLGWRASDDRHLSHIFAR